MKRLVLILFLLSWAAPASARTFMLDGTIALTHNRTFASDTMIQYQGGIFSCGAFTLTINGPIAAPPNVQLFDSTCDPGEVVFPAASKTTEIHAMWWGIDISGATNNQTALRGAFDAIQGGSKTLRLPEGTILMSPVLIGGATRLRIRGPNTTLIGGGNATILFADPAAFTTQSTGYTFVNIEASNVTLKDFVIDGNKSNITGMTSYTTVGLRIPASLSLLTNLVMNNLECRNLGAAAGLEGACLFFPIVSSGGVNGVYLSNMRAKNNNASAWGCTGDYAAGHDVKNFFLDGGYFDGGTFVGTGGYGCENVYITNVTISNFDRAGINFEWCKNCHASNFVVIDNRECVSLYGLNEDIYLENGTCLSNDNETVGPSDQVEITIRANTWAAIPTTAISTRIYIDNVFIYPSSGERHGGIFNDPTVTVGNSIPERVAISGGNWQDWLWKFGLFDGGTSTTRWIPTVEFLDHSAATEWVGHLGDASLSALTVATYSGSGNLDADAQTLTPTAQFASYNLPYSLTPFTKYLTCFRYQSTGTGEWILVVNDPNTGQLPGARMQISGPNSSTLTGEWRTGCMIFTTDADPHHLVWQYQTASPMETLHLDLVQIYPLQSLVAASSKALHSRQQQLCSVITSANQTVQLDIVPNNAVVRQVSLDVTTAFNSDGTDQIRIGSAATPTLFAALTDVSTVGAKSIAAGTLAIPGKMTSGAQIRAEYVNGGSEPGAGEAVFCVQYVTTR